MSRRTSRAKPALRPRHNENLPFPAHFGDGRFFNPGVPSARALAGVLKWKLTSTSRAESSPQYIPIEPSVPPASIDSPSLLVTLVNHSTVLLQQPGSNILTDPI